jgi:3-phenylpropionate/trans-cinnamate dioxygenase ferredoxin subunit
VFKMSNPIEIGDISEFEDGKMKELLIKGREILVARIGNSYYAIDNRCPHLGGKLSKGKLEGTVVTCPVHGSQFDISNGQVLRWMKGSGLFAKVGKILKSPRPLVTYKTNLLNEKLFIEM